MLPVVSTTRAAGELSVILPPVLSVCTCPWKVRLKLARSGFAANINRRQTTALNRKRQRAAEPWRSDLAKRELRPLGVTRKPGLVLTPKSISLSSAGLVNMDIVVAPLPLGSRPSWPKLLDLIHSNPCFVKQV